MNKYIIEIKRNKAISSSIQKIGGKAMSLAIMAKHGINMPRGIVVGVNAYDLFLKENNLIGAIDKMSKLSSKKAVFCAAEKIQKIILTSKIPDDIVSEINLWIQTSNIKRYAVRSSANVEDAAKRSWAGQFDSYLNVPSSMITINIRKCWASVFNSRVVNYASSIKSISSIKMAVIVQESLDCEVSGVCFTKNPLMSNDKNILIEAVFGLGELLVQGEAVPDTYKIERGSNIITEADVNEQKIIYAGVRKGGSKSMRIKRTFKQKISGREMIDLTKIALKIEKIYNKGCDIEWCKKGNKMYILQARPITTGKKT